MSKLFGLCAALVFLLAAGVAQAQAPAGDPILKQREQAERQPGNNAPVWGQVRKEAAEYYTSIPGRETNVLVQSAGQTWRQIRNGPVTFYGGWLVVIIGLLIAAYYFAKGPIKPHDKPTGRMVHRFSTAEQVVHWCMGISFVVLGLSGLVMLFGKYVLLPIIGYTLFGWLSALAKNLHNFVGPFFIVATIVFVVMFVRDNLLKAYDFSWFAKAWAMYARGEHTPSGRFNAGEKGWFWICVVVLSVIVSYTGVILLFPNFDQTRATMQEAWVWHASASLIYIAVSLGHIYMGTIGVEGAYQAMRSGSVDESWAKEHYELWYNEVKSGKAAASGGAVPAGAPRIREKS